MGKMIWSTRTGSPADTEKLGERLGSLLVGRAVIELRADLGGGKTTFVRGLARGLGSQDIVASPTFTLNKIYKGRAGMQIHHFDFYRLSQPGVVAEQLKESLENPKAITIVEWSDIVQAVLPEKRLSLEFRPDEQDSEAREVQISYPYSYAGLIKKLETRAARLKP